MPNKKTKRPFKALALILAVITIAAIGAVALVTRYYPMRYMDTIEKYAAEYDLPPELVCAVIHAESRFNSEAVSNKGASGLMQIMESTAYWLAPKAGIEDFDYSRIFDPETNIRLGCYYLNMLKTQYGDLNTALCAYNAGSGNVSRWLEQPEYSEDGKTLIYIPFEETRNYVEKIADNQKIYGFIIKIQKKLPF